MKSIMSLIIISLITIGQFAHADILCLPKETSESLKCLTIAIPAEVYDSTGNQFFLNAGSATAYLSENREQSVQVSIEMENGNINRVTSLNRGFQLDLNWKNFKIEKNSGGSIDGSLNIFDLRTSYQGRLLCGSSFDTKLKAACGL